VYCRIGLGLNIYDFSHHNYSVFRFNLCKFLVFDISLLSQPPYDVILFGNIWHQELKTTVLEFAEIVSKQINVMWISSTTTCLIKTSGGKCWFLSTNNTYTVDNSIMGLNIDLTIIVIAVLNNSELFLMF